MFSIDREATQSYLARPARAEIETMAKPVNEDELVAVAIKRLEEGRKVIGCGTKRSRETKGICTETTPAGVMRAPTTS